MAYINYQGNIFADCIITGALAYKEEAGEYKREMTRAFAQCKEATPDGMQTVNLDLRFFSGFAIPAYKLQRGMCVVVLGRELAKEKYTHGRNVLNRIVTVDWWWPRDVDPLGMLEELKARRAIAAQENELEHAVAALLEKCMPIIIKKVIEELDSRAKANKIIIP